MNRGDGMEDNNSNGNVMENKKMKCKIGGDNKKEVMVMYNRFSNSDDM